LSGARIDPKTRVIILDEAVKEAYFTKYLKAKKFKNKPLANLNLIKRWLRSTVVIGEVRITSNAPRFTETIDLDNDDNKARFSFLEGGGGRKLNTSMILER